MKFQSLGRDSERSNLQDTYVQRSITPVSIPRSGF